MDHHSSDVVYPRRNFPHSHLIDRVIARERVSKRGLTRFLPFISQAPSVHHFWQVKALHWQ